MANVVLVSACLLGLPTRYDGRSAVSDEVLGAAAEGAYILVPVCPEQLGGLPTPRAAHFIERGTGENVLAGCARVLSAEGADATECFLRGARTVARVAELVGAREAWLKEKSPSCGVEATTSAGGERPGAGVTAALLRGRGLALRGFP